MIEIEEDEERTQAAYLTGKAAVSYFMRLPPAARGSSMHMAAKVATFMEEELGVNASDVARFHFHLCGMLAYAHGSVASDFPKAVFDEAIEEYTRLMADCEAEADA